MSGERLFRFMGDDRGAPLFGCFGNQEHRWPLPTRQSEGTWTPGDWFRPNIPDLNKPTTQTQRLHRDPCWRPTLFFTFDVFAVCYLGPYLYEAEAKGAEAHRVAATDMVEVRSDLARLLRPLEGWNEQAMWLLAADSLECALSYAGMEDETPWSVVHLARQLAFGDALESDLEGCIQLAKAEAKADQSARRFARYAARWEIQGEHCRARRCHPTRRRALSVAGHAMDAARHAVKQAPAGNRSEGNALVLRRWQGRRLVAYGDGAVDLDAIREAAQRRRPILCGRIGSLPE